jgi:hypothetical protein
MSWLWVGVVLFGMKPQIPAPPIYPGMERWDNDHYIMWLTWNKHADAENYVYEFYGTGCDVEPKDHDCSEAGK